MHWTRHTPEQETNQQTGMASAKPRRAKRVQRNARDDCKPAY